MDLKINEAQNTHLCGSVAEWSKALDLGSSLSGGVGSNPTAATNFWLMSSKNAYSCRDL